VVDVRYHGNKVINVSLVMSCQSCQFRHWHKPLSCQSRVNLRWSYTKYNNFCIKGKIITLVDITCANYVKKLSCKVNTCTLGWRIKRKLNDETILNVIARNSIGIFFINRKILAIHLIHYIDFNSLLHHVINLNWPSSWNGLWIWTVMCNT
jgi:hypothetical protein